MLKDEAAKRKFEQENPCVMFCVCGLETGWVNDGEITSPCPECGRKWLGFYHTATVKALNHKE